MADPAGRRRSRPGRGPILTLVLTLALAACDRASPPAVVSLQGLAQGTFWNVQFWSSSPVDAAALQRRIEAEFERLDQALSNYRPDSLIEGFNAARTTAPVAVGAEIVALVQAAAAVSEASGGCYDLTVKPLFELWGFAGDALTPPTPERLADALSRVGFRQLGVIPPDRLEKRLADLRVDLSSIAQGYSVGRVAGVLEAADITNYLVELGGELQVRGRKPDASPWRVAIERPAPGARRMHTGLAIDAPRPLAVMTSGTYRHYFDADGRRYSHVLDARSGTPVAHRTVSVTVVDPDPTRADAWSTALLCLGQETGIAVADRAGVAALFIDQLEDGGLREYPSGAWPGGAQQLRP